MFGKKKTETASSAPTEKKAKSKAKSAASKSRVTANRGPNFFIAHIEKMGLVLIAALAGFLLYRSVSQPTLPDSQTPSHLAGEAQNLLNKVRNESHWDAMYPEREAYERQKFHASTLQARKPADPSNYAIGKLEPPSIKEQYEQRTDPAILPAEQVFVRNISGTLGTWVLVSDKNRDPYLDMEDAEPIGRRSGSNRSRGSGPGGSDRSSGSQESDGGQGFESGMTNSSAQRRKLKAKYDLGAQFGSVGAGGMGGMGDDGGSGMGLGGGSFDPGGGGDSRGGEGRGGGGGGTGTSSAENEVGGILLGSARQRSNGGELLNDQQRIRYRLSSQPVVFNSITALIPHRKNEEQFFRAFSRTGTFMAGRDIPVYLGIEVQRVEVTGDPNRAIQEDEWKTILTNKEISETPKKHRWATHLPDLRPKPIPDVIHARYSLVGLTAPIVPLLVRDYREFSKHPKIEWRWNTRLPRPPQRPGSDNTSGSDDDDVVFGQGGSSQGGMGTGGLGPDGPGGRGDDGAEGGFGGGLGGFGGMGDEGGEDGRGGMGGGFEEGGGFDEGGGDRDGGMGGMGGPGGLGGMGGGGGFGGGRTEASIALMPEYKMVRVYDFLDFKDVGKIFKYRMRVAMRDPNYPENQDYYGNQFARFASSYLPPPSSEELAHEVYERVTELKRQEDKQITEALEKKVYKARAMRFTAWSEPSQPVAVASPVEAFAGLVDPKGVAKLAVAQLSRRNELPGAVMATELEVKRGSLLGIPQSKIDFIAPTTKVIKRMDKFSTLTGAVVVDMRGGQPLAGHSAKDDPQTAEGEIMIVRPDGSLLFSSDWDDQFLYRMYTFQDDIEASKTRQNTGDNTGGFDPGGGGPDDGGRGGR